MNLDSKKHYPTFKTVVLVGRPKIFLLCCSVFKWYFFGTKPVARLRNGNASVKGKVLAHFQVVNQGELGRGR